MVGGGLAGADTAMAKAGSELVRVPSLTLITMPEKMPTLAVVAVPESCPVVLLKLAQDGRLATENVSASPSGSLAVGVNEELAPATRCVDGVPPITGA